MVNGMHREVANGAPSLWSLREAWVKRSGIIALSLVGLVGMPIAAAWMAGDDDSYGSATSSSTAWANRASHNSTPLVTTEAGKFTSPESCVAAGNTEADCQAAYQTAYAEHFKTAPRFGSEAACEASMGGDCTESKVANADGTFRSVFLPAMAGYALATLIRPKQQQQQQPAASSSSSSGGGAFVRSSRSRGGFGSSGYGGG